MDAVIDAVEASAHTIPTDARECDGTFALDRRPSFRSADAEAFRVA